MGSTFFFNPISIFILTTFSYYSSAQQPYVGKATTDCNNQYNSSSGLGYFCNNGLNRTCQAYLTFRSLSPYDSVSTISALLGSDPGQLSQLNSVSESSTFETNKLVLVPINCSCSGEFYQANTSYSIPSGGGFLITANNTFQGLSTCQAIQYQNSNLTATDLQPGTRIVVPLRCACPSKNQIDSGFNYLLSYLIKENDSVRTISERFGSDFQSTLQANELTESSTINFFTTLLVPLKSPPTSNQTVESPPPPPPPPSTPSPTSNEKSKKKTWVYILIGVLVGGGVVLIIGIFIFYKLSKKKGRANTDSTYVVSENFPSFEKPLNNNVDDESCESVIESLSSMTQSISVYSFKELQLATDNFAPSSLIKGSVYRGTIKGDFAAIKKMNGEVSKEIALLNKINHSNLIRLSGVCFNEGHWFLVYEYAANGPLSDWIYDNNSSDKKILSWTQRIQIGLDVATGLNYLHSFSIPPHVHKDIKSSNVLLDSDFRAKIASFGLARSAESQEGEFQLTRHIVGTRGYMAPEYVEHGLVSTKLDVYSFGVLLTEMITGKEVSELYGNSELRVFEVLNGVVIDEKDDAVLESLRQIMDPSLIGTYPGGLVVFIANLIRSCLRKDPSERPSMEEIIQSLSRTLSSSLAWESSKTEFPGNN